MTPERYEQLKSLFLAAREMSASARIAFLSERCGDDVELREQVDSMIAADAGGHIDRSTANPATATATIPVADINDSARVESPPLKSDLFPGYRVLREIHRGGQGVVYQAIQESTHRKVAIKVLLGGITASQSMRRRFEREVALVANLKHPNIITVFDSGELSDGLQYCVMDYVRGAPLADDARDRDLGLESRLSLFAQVCEAISYAHQRGVIHRDLKPSNILVDGSGQPRVLDFGLAKQIGQGSDTLVSMTGQVMGTLQYMSPEQARGNPDEIDIRTDVYSLGVILYELLTGRLPYSMEGSISDILRRITESIVAPPSRQWSETTGVRRRTTGRLGSRCPIDDELDTIVARALAKDRERRYQTAGDLGRDLRRYLAGEPIDAKRDSGWYVLRRSLQRHWAATTVAIVIVVLVGASAVVFAAMHQKERRLRDLAQKQSADIRAFQRREANSMLEGIYGRLVYNDYHSTKPTSLTEPLEHAINLGGDPKRAEVILALAEIGSGSPAAAAERLSDFVTSNPDRTEAKYLLAWALRENGEDSKADEMLAGADDGGGAATPAAAFFKGLAVHRPDPEAAIRSYGKAIDLRREKGEFFPQAVLHLARAHNQRMYRERTLESFEDAEARLRVYAEHEKNSAYPFYLLSITHRLAAEILREQDSPDAELRSSEHFEQALRWATEGQGVDPTDDRPIAAEAECLEAMGWFDQALLARTRALKILEGQSAGPASRIDIGRYEALHYRWRLYYWLGKSDAALGDLETIAMDYASSRQERRLYGNVFAALVLADAGDLESARQRTMMLIDAENPGLTDLIWCASLLNILEQRVAAHKLLSRHYPTEADDLDTEGEARDWSLRLCRFCMGAESLQNVIDTLDRSESDSKAYKGQVAEIQFHAAAAALGERNRAAARRHLESAYRQFDGEQGYTYLAKTLLVRMKRDADWPHWWSGVSPATAAKEHH